MKKFLLLALFATLAPAMAQTNKATAPQSTAAKVPATKAPTAQPTKAQISPEVLELFDKAAFSYTGLASYSGDVRIEIQNMDGEKGLNAVTSGTFFYARKARLLFEGKIEAQLGGDAKRTGITTFKSDGNRYQTTQSRVDGEVEVSPVLPLDKTLRADAAWQKAPLDSLSPLLIAGINDLRDTKDPLLGEMLPPKTEGDESFDGVRLTATSGEMKGLEVLAYFDSKHHLLRDLTLTLDIDGNATKVRTTYSNLKFNPTIPLNSFKIN